MPLQPSRLLRRQSNAPVSDNSTDGTPNIAETLDTIGLESYHKFDDGGWKCASSAFHEMYYCPCFVAVLAAFIFSADKTVV